MHQVLTRFMRDESAATAIEYALVASLIAAVIVGAVSSIGTRLSALFDRIASKIP